MNSLLESIYADLEDAAPRRIYADWLQEYSREQSDHDLAKFIQVQCDLDIMGKPHLRWGFPGTNERANCVLDKVGNNEYAISIPNYDAPSLGRRIDVNRMFLSRKNKRPDKIYHGLVVTRITPDIDETHVTLILKRDSLSKRFPIKTYDKLKETENALIWEYKSRWLRPVAKLLPKCTLCKGIGDCSYCGGHGFIYEYSDPTSVKYECTECKEGDCKRCEGTGNIFKIEYVFKQGFLDTLRLQTVTPWVGMECNCIDPTGLTNLTVQCDKCNKTGYIGGLGSEIKKVTPTLRRVHVVDRFPICHNNPTGDIHWSCDLGTRYSCYIPKCLVDLMPLKEGDTQTNRYFKNLDDAFNTLNKALFA